MVICSNSIRSFTLLRSCSRVSVVVMRLYGFIVSFENAANSVLVEVYGEKICDKLAS